MNNYLYQPNFSTPLKTAGFFIEGGKFAGKTHSPAFFFAISIVYKLANKYIFFSIIYIGFATATFATFFYPL